MAGLGSLVVSLAVDAAKFTAGLSKAARQSEMFAQNARRVGAAVGAAMAAAGTAMAYAVKRSIDTADSMTKLSRSLGVTTEELSAFAYAADLSGVSTESFGTAMTRLAKNASDARKGTGEAIDAFRAMGIALVDANGKAKTQADLLTEIADRFAGYADGANKTALAVSIFGRSGAQMISMLNGGRAGLEAMRDEMQALGLTLTKDAGEKAEMFNDNLTRLRKVQDGLVVQLRDQMLPSLVAFSNTIFDAAKNSDLLKGTAQVLGDGFRVLLTVLTAIGSQVYVVSLGLSGIIAAAGQLASGEFRLAKIILEQTAGDIGAAYSRAGDIIASFWERNIEGAKAAQAATKGALPDAPQITDAPKNTTSAAAKKAAADAQRVKDTIDGLRDSIRLFGRESSEATIIDLERMGASQQQIDDARSLMGVLRELEREKERQQEVEDATREKALEGVRVTEMVVTATERYHDELVRLNDLKREGFITEQTYYRRLKQLQDEYSEEAKRAREESDRLKRLGEDVGASFSSAFEDAIVSGKGFKDLLKGLEQDVLRLGTRFLITEPLARSIAKMFDPTAAGISGGGGGGWMDAVTGWAGGTLRSILGGSLFGGGGDWWTALADVGLAKGGVIDRPSLAMIGEGTMAEAVVPLPDGRKIPVEMRSGGDRPVNISFTVHAKDADSFRRSEAQIQSMLNKAARQGTRNL